MRINIRHDLHFTYEPPARAIIHVLRLNPRGHEGQHVANWRLDVDVDCRTKMSEDAYGNSVCTFTIDGPVEAINISVEGEIETFDTAGVVRQAVERFPPELFTRESPLAYADDALRAFASEATIAGGDTLQKLHALMGALAKTIAFEPTKTLDANRQKPGKAFAAEKGDAIDIAHMFVAMARFLNIPARFIAGYYFVPEAGTASAHYWAEGFVPGLGWVGFDPAHALCPGEAHVRVACGLDYLDAAPTRFANVIGAVESADMKIKLISAQTQTQ